MPFTLPGLSDGGYLFTLRFVGCCSWFGGDTLQLVWWRQLHLFGEDAGGKEELLGVMRLVYAGSIRLAEPYCYRSGLSQVGRLSPSLL
jgi:hypothetical protein